jgi:hypothetical protein
VKTTQQQRDMLRADATEELAGYTSPLTAAVRKYPEATLALLDDLDELRECLLLARPYVPELLNGKPLGVYARCTAALSEPEEPT